MDFRSPLSKARGLGSAKEGAAHWWAQRVTAIALIPLVIWFVVNIIQSTATEMHLLAFIVQPMNAILMILSIGFGLYHGTLGIQVILEDYVHRHCMRTALVLLVQFISIVAAVSGILAIIAVHVSLYNG